MFGQPAFNTPHLIAGNIPTKERVMDFKDKRVLVTGGAGFIGSHLADQLIRGGARVTVLDDLSLGKRENVPSAASFVEVDIQDSRGLRVAVADQEVIFHLAACPTTKESSMGWADPVHDYQVNAVGTLNLLRAAMESKQDPLFVYASSAAVYGRIRYTPIDEAHPTDPVSPYGISKLAGEKYCLAYHWEFGLPVVILRVFNCYGPRQPRYVMHDLIMKLRRDSSVLHIIGDGSQIRDFCYVDDVTNAFLLACQAPGHVFNVASGIPTTVMSVAESIRDCMAPQARIISEGESWRGDIPTLVGNVERLRHIGFSPKVDLSTGIQKLVASYSPSVGSAVVTNTSGAS